MSVKKSQIFGIYMIFVGMFGNGALTSGMKPLMTVEKARSTKILLWPIAPLLIVEFDEVEHGCHLP
jgi:hypothetical protein